jgi:hypothetical protein
MMGGLSKVSFVLAIFHFLLSFVDAAAHRHYHRHNDKVIARATASSLSLLSSPATPAGYGLLLDDPATPCSDSACPTADPNLSNICPARNETNWIEFPTAQNYTVICDVDFPPAQNIYPFVLASSFEDCMAQCESYNAKKAGDDDRCEGFVFAPERLEFADDCYLKSSLDGPFPATIPLVGATRAASFASVATPVDTQSNIGGCCPPINFGNANPSL